VSDTIHIRFTSAKLAFRYVWRDGRLVSAFPRPPRASKGWRRHIRRQKAAARR
jgi:hypothetical protein